MAVGMHLIAVGDELLEGRTSDTNSTRVQRAFGQHAVAVRDVQVVPDAQAAIVAALDRTSPDAVVMLSGGLGSTADDLTREAVAAWAGVPLETDATTADALIARLAARGITAYPDTLKQAQVPRGLTPLGNPVGSAPGLIGRLRDRWVALLPGVPAELDGLLPLVRAHLHAHGVLPAARVMRLWRVAQVAELALARECEPVRSAHPGLTWSWWIGPWGVDVRVAAAPGQEIALAAAVTALAPILGDRVFAEDAVSLPRVVLDRLVARGATVAVAESCTGGLLGGALTEEPGSSHAFRGGLITYADSAKQDLLGVPAAMLATHGAVSREVAGAMAVGARARLGTDYALAITGIAGPEGGSADKPVGTTWIALATPADVLVGRYRFPATRERNRGLAVAAALDTLRRALDGVPVFAPSRLSWGVLA